MVLSAIIIFAIFVLIYAIVVIVDLKNAKKRQVKYTFKRALTAFLFLLPAAVLAYFFVMLPILYSLGYAFTKAETTDFIKGKEITFKGFYQFIKAFGHVVRNDDKLGTAIKNTGLFVVLVVPIQIGLALLLALFCNAKMRGNTVFKVCFFAPVVISLAITSYLWREILSSSDRGMFNSFLKMFGVPAQDYLKDENVTMFWIVIVSAWQGCGFQMLIFLSALSGIRKELYEAARMDGCNAIQRFFKVTLPGLKPTMLYILITVFIGACRIMVQPMLMVGYHDQAVTLSYYMYEHGFSRGEVGYSCAIALIMTIFIGGITFVQRKVLGEKK